MTSSAEQKEKKNFSVHLLTRTFISLFTFYVICILYTRGPHFTKCPTQWKKTKCRWKKRKIPRNTECWAFFGFCSVMKTWTCFVQNFLQVWSVPRRWKQGQGHGFTHLNTGFTYPLPLGYVKNSSKQLQGELLRVVCFVDGVQLSASNYSLPAWETWEVGLHRFHRSCLLRGTPCFHLYPSYYYRWKKNIHGLAKKETFPPSILFWNMKHSVCVWPLHTTLPIVQCDETFVLAWIETLFSYLMLWYKKMFFKQKTLHL